MKKTDTVPAMLTKGEAVLSRNAAELLGRDAIKRLNAHGNMLAKRGVDLASLQSDPAPYPASENLAGLQMGTADVGRDDRAELLRDADNTFYGGGQAPSPTPTPVPRAYQYGTSSVDDFGSPFLKKKNMASRINRPGIINIQDDPTKPNYNPVSTSQYIGRGGTLLGNQYNQTTGRVNPLPTGAVGIQGFAQRQASNFAAASQPLTHTEMAADIARRNLASIGSSLGTPQEPVDDPNRPSNISSSSYQAFKDQMGTTTHFLPPGFTATTGSTGVPGSTPNDIHFLPPGFSSVQGVTNPVTKQLQQPKDEGYGSAYGY